MDWNEPWMPLGLTSREGIINSRPIPLLGARPPLVQQRVYSFSVNINELICEMVSRILGSLGINSRRNNSMVRMVTVTGECNWKRISTSREKHPSQKKKPLKLLDYLVIL